MNYADIKSVDIQDGTGVRVSIYVSGCHFHCKGCHNKEAWDFNYGKKFDDKTIDFIIGEMDHDYISGLSILGGEPLELENQKELVKLVEKVKKKYPKKDIWCYTGYKFKEDVLGNMYKKYDFTKNFLKNIDIIVDGNKKHLECFYSDKYNIQIRTTTFRIGLKDFIFEHEYFIYDTKILDKIFKKYKIKYTYVTNYSYQRAKHSSNRVHIIIKKD